MSGLEDAAYSALVGLIESTWAGLTDVVREEQVGRTNWENLLAGAALAPPFAVVALGPGKPEGWGLDNLVFRLPVKVTAVVSIADANAALGGGGTDVTAYLLQQLGLLRAALVGYSGGAFQLAGELPVVDCATHSQANQVLLNLLAGLQAGELSCGLLIGESVS
ncbi:MAG: hypothetical protein ACYC96_15240 [Fimbriimonadaceae bacterium]